MPYTNQEIQDFICHLRCPSTSDQSCPICHEPYPEGEAFDPDADFPSAPFNRSQHSGCQHVFSNICTINHCRSGREYSNTCPMCREVWFGSSNDDNDDNDDSNEGDVNDAVGNLVRYFVETRAEAIADLARARARLEAYHSNIARIQAQTAERLAARNGRTNDVWYNEKVWKAQSQRKEHEATVVEELTRLEASVE